MPPRPALLFVILGAYLLTLFTLVHTFHLALHLPPERRPQTSSAPKVAQDTNSTAELTPNDSAFPFTSFKYTTLHPGSLLSVLFDPKPESGNGVGWLARLGWGLGEATVEVLESSPPQSFEARMAFFGRSIPEDGLMGWLVPLDSLFRPCPSLPADQQETSPNSKPTLQPPSITTPRASLLPPPFLPLDGAYVPPEVENDTLDQISPEHLENTGCPPQCPTTHLFSDSSPDSASPMALADPIHPFPNTTWLALVRRGTCSFATKARFAESLGASGLLVGGLDESLISMSAGSGDGEIGIRSVFVGNRTYTALINRVQESGVRLGVDVGLGDSARMGAGAGVRRHDEAIITGRSVKTILIRLEGEPPWEWYTPILSVLLVLSLPSLLTLCTLFVHRLRAERREREMRAPEDVVAGLPIRVWSGVRWEKDLESGNPTAPSGDSTAPTERSPILPVRSASKEGDRAVRAGYGTVSDAEPSTSAPNILASLTGRSGSGVDINTEEGALAGFDKDATPKENPTLLSPTRAHASGQLHRQEESDETIPRPPWFTSQTECAICLCNFEVGDRVRVLPCGHVFHLDEVDPWLIKQRKVCPVCKYDVTNPPTALVPPSSSPLAIAAPLPTDIPEEPLLPLVDHFEGTPETGSDTSSNSPMAPAQPLTAAQLLASVDERQRGWRRWLGRRFRPGSTSSSEERVERRGDGVGE